MTGALRSIPHRDLVLVLELTSTMVVLMKVFAVLDPTLALGVGGAKSANITCNRASASEYASMVEYLGRVIWYIFLGESPPYLSAPLHPHDKISNACARACLKPLNLPQIPGRPKERLTFCAVCGTLE